MTRSRCRRWLALLAFVPLAAACSGPARPSTMCTAIGAASGVTFDVRAWTKAHPTATQAKACVDSTCRTTMFNRWPHVQVTDQLLGPGSAQVSLTIRDARGHVLFDAQTSVPLHKSQPNGPRCEPTVWRAWLVPTADGRLEPPAAPSP